MVRVTALMDDHASEHKALTAEHGLSYLVEMPELRLLFDCGASAVPMANAHRLGLSLKEQGFFDIYPAEKERWYVKAPVFSFNKIRGLDAYLTPEMKSTGEAIGYDNNLTHALYKAMQASGMKLENYGTVFVTISDEDKEEALPLIRRFYRLGFNIEATVGTAVFLRQHGIKTRVRAKVDDGSDEILKSIRKGYVTYVINTMDVRCEDVHSGSSQIRRCAVENGVTMLTALDTVRVLLDVLEEITLGISTIDAWFLPIWSRSTRAAPFLCQGKYFTKVYIILVHFSKLRRAAG